MLGYPGGKGGKPQYGKGAKGPSALGANAQKGASGMSQAQKMKNSGVVVSNFPPSWGLAGSEVLGEFIQAQLESFGKLSTPVKVSPDMKEAEAAFEEESEASEAISVLNAADLRGEEDKADTPGYTGLNIRVKAIAVRVQIQSMARPPLEVFAAPVEVSAAVEEKSSVLVQNQSTAQQATMATSDWNGQSQSTVRAKGSNATEATSIGNGADADPWGSTLAPWAQPQPSVSKGKGKSNFKGTGFTGEKVKVGSAGLKKGSAGAQTEISKPAIASMELPPVSMDSVGGVQQFQGAWSVRFEFEEKDEPGRWRSWEMNYKISDTGEVRVGKKTRAMLVPAGSPKDHIQDPNYHGMYIIVGLPEPGSWEYVWIQDGVMKVHHFLESDTGTSPLGSPCFSCFGEGRLKDGKQPNEPAEADGFESAPSKKKAKASIDGGAPPEPQDRPVQHVPNLPEWEGIWYKQFWTAKGEHDGGKMSIFENGEVKMGKKTRLQLVYAGSPDDVRMDPNYQFEGCYLLNKVSGEGTWEYLWLIDGVIHLHNFGSHENGTSPFGSPNFWGEGVASTTKTSSAKSSGGSIGAYAAPPRASGSEGGPTLREVFGGQLRNQQKGSWGGDSWGKGADSWDDSSWGGKSGKGGKGDKSGSGAWGPGGGDSWGPGGSAVTMKGGKGGSGAWGPGGGDSWGPGGSAVAMKGGKGGTGAWGPGGGSIKGGKGGSAAWGPVGGDSWGPGGGESLGQGAGDASWDAGGPPLRAMMEQGPWGDEPWGGDSQVPGPGDDSWGGLGKRQRMF